MSTRIYLDYNATAPLKPEIAAEIAALPRIAYNPSSIHSFGREARRRIEDARAQLMAACGAPSNYACVFTSSGTEANNLALAGLECDTLLVSAIEHASVLHIEHANKHLIPVTDHGIIDLAALEHLLQLAKGKTVISVMFANNETGIIQPIREAAALAHRYGALVHTDAVQAFGRIEFSITELSVDLITISGHKCGAPLGAAALIYRQSLSIHAMMQGGGQERKLRPGTENVPAIIGLGHVTNCKTNWQAVADLRDTLETLLTGGLIIGKDVARLPNTSLIIMPGNSSETQVIHFDLQGIAISSGSACSSGRVNLSHVLPAMGISEALAGCAIRVSLGDETTKEDIVRFTTVWNALFTANRSKIAA